MSIVVHTVNIINQTQYRRYQTKSNRDLLMKGCLLMLLIHVGKICTYDEDVAYRNVIYKKTAL